MLSILLIALSLSMDAFAVSVSCGLSGRNFTKKSALKISTYFAIAQFIMPILGFLLMSIFYENVHTFGSYISFFLLEFVGVKMFFDAVCDEASDFSSMGLSSSHLIILALATSLDAFAIGASFSFMEVHLFSACVVIGTVTFIVCYIGAVTANKFSGASPKIATILASFVLIAIGIKFLLTELF